MTTPLALDLSALPVALAGAGPAVMKRLSLLDAENVPALAVYSAEADAMLIAAAGSRLIGRWPVDEDIAAVRVLFVAGLPDEQSSALATVARAHRVLVNVEDILHLCDFHVPAIVRRGDLALSISTGGASPTLARRLRVYLGELFPPDWSQRIARISDLRRTMRDQGSDMREVAAATDALIDAESWLARP